MSSKYPLCHPNNRAYLSLNVSCEIAAAIWCCDFRVGRVSVGGELPFISVLSVQSFGFVTCVLVAWGGRHPSFRSCLWGRCFPSLGIIMTGACTMTSLCSCHLDQQSLLFAPWHMAVLVRWSLPWKHNLVMWVVWALASYCELISDAWLVGWEPPVAGVFVSDPFNILRCQGLWKELKINLENKT